MAEEIERKFLVRNDEWRQNAKAVFYRQGYIYSSVSGTVRVRIINDRAFLAVKSGRKGIRRQEFEYEIPLQDGRQMYDYLCLYGKVEKKRYQLRYGGLLWEIDEFTGANRGLILAEVELSDANDQIREWPPWIGKEVSDDHRYYNAYLAKYPYPSWDE